MIGASENGENIGMKFSYKVQDSPKGIAEAFILGESFIANDDVTLILGDNLFYGNGYLDFLKGMLNDFKGAMLFGYPVKDPERYGVVEFDESGKVLSLEEKPQNPKTNYAVPGLYFYSNNVIEVAKTIEPSNRGELEISSVNQHFINQSKLEVKLFGRGATWLDTGSSENLLRASNFVEIIQNRRRYLRSKLRNDNVRTK